MTQSQPVSTGRPATPPLPVVAGVGVVVAGILLIVFSFMGWATNDESTISVSGLGSVSADGIDEHMESMLETSTHATGVWTIVFGVLLVLAGLALVFRLFPQMSGVFAGLIGIAAFITTVVFFADPAGVLPDEVTSADHVNRGTGLWLVFIGGIIGLVAGVLAFVATNLGDKLGKR
ncbi:hypothetical protein [Gordonia humi]|uniref:Uncharacterized membrane protein HdeD (DUF308 family) n=1 Tax=Gordonia humi TaxID=686429 RepID=A0A840F4B1_9ACTN|nr:hypothetical protein [Gordonia humi]MBB4135110.1 uncharacterized membrane protein HdeD (DUF308 family) [Gordonia humi]